MANPFHKYLTKEDRLQNAVINYFRINYPDAFVIHVPNEGKRTPFERFKFKHLGGVAGVPDILCFAKNENKGGLAMELKVGYNKPTEGQKRCLKHLKNANWEVAWFNNYEETCNFIDKYFKNEL